MLLTLWKVQKNHFLLLKKFKNTWSAQLWFYAANDLYRMIWDFCIYSIVNGCGEMDEDLGKLTYIDMLIKQDTKQNGKELTRAQISIIRMYYFGGFV